MLFKKWNELLELIGAFQLFFIVLLIINFGLFQLSLLIRTHLIIEFIIYIIISYIICLSIPFMIIFIEFLCNYKIKIIKRNEEEIDYKKLYEETMRDDI